MAPEKRKSNAFAILSLVGSDIEVGDDQKFPSLAIRLHFSYSLSDISFPINATSLLLNFPNRLIQFASRTVGNSQPFLVMTSTPHLPSLQPLTAAVTIPMLQLPSAPSNCQFIVFIEIAARDVNLNETDVKQLWPDDLILT